MSPPSVLSRPDIKGICILDPITLTINGSGSDLRTSLSRRRINQNSHRRLSILKWVRKPISGWNDPFTV